MDHLAIMKKSWNLTSKVLSGEKTIETRWYKNKSAPWGRIHKGDAVYFKDTGCLVTVKATVSKVEQYSNLNNYITQKILSTHSTRDLGTTEISDEINAYTKNKKYCIIIHLIKPKKVEPPFDISKKGFGLMSAWIAVKSINEIKINTK